MIVIESGGITMYEKELEKLLTEKGADAVGFSYLGESVSPDYPEYRYAVTIMRRLSRAVLKTIGDAPTMVYFQHYRATNARLDSIALDGVSFIEDKGFLALPVAASQSTPDKKEEFRGIFPHKTGAVLSGLGWIGRSGLLVTEKFGPAVRMATILTDMPLEPSGERLPCLCGDCRACVDACPAKAITGAAYVPGAERSTVFDAKKCSEHMKTYKDIGRGAVCGLCMAACVKAHLK